MENKIKPESPKTDGLIDTEEMAKTTENVFTKHVEPLSPFKYFLISLGESLLKFVYWIVDFIVSIFLSLGHFIFEFFKNIKKMVLGIGKFFQRKAHQFKYNDKYGRANFFLFGVSSLKNKQYTNGVLFIVFQIAYLALFIAFGIPELMKLPALGPGGMVCIPVYDQMIGQYEECAIRENSILVLIYAILWLMSLILYAYIWNRSINSGYRFYRINNFTKYKNLTNDTIEISDYISNLILNNYGIGNEAEMKLTVQEIKDLLKSINADSLKEYKYRAEIAKNNAKIEKLKAKGNDETLINDINEKNASLAASINDLVNSYDKEDTKENKLRKEIFNYLHNQDDKATRDYIIYLLNGSVVNATEYVKKYNDLRDKIANLEHKKEQYNEKRLYDRDQLVQKNNGLVANNSLTREDNDIALEKFDAKTTSNIAKRDLKIKKANHLFDEHKKRYSAFAEQQNVINNKNYGKYNFYFKNIERINNDLVFWKNYRSLADLYAASLSGSDNQNSENKEKIVTLESQTKDKIANINSKFDDSLKRRGEIEAQIKETKDRYNEDVKAIKASGSENMSEELINAKEKLVDTITRLNRKLNDLPNAKTIKAMRKEEVGEVKHSYSRDKRYLKTNFTPDSYARQHIIDTLLLEYKLEYQDAVYYANSLFKNKGKDALPYTDEEVKDKVDALEKEKADFIEANPSKYVGKMNNFGQQIKALFNENFHITILFLPLLGILVFTVMPLIFSILIAFTNFGDGHLPPTQPFVWVGFKNFINLFNPSATSIFRDLPAALAQTLSWTIVWAFFATFSNYILGIIVALLINKESIKLKKLWRTVFVITIAVPQFISLLSISTLLADTGAIGKLWYDLFGWKLGFGSSTHTVALAKTIIILVNIWVGIPYTILSTTGILLNIPKDLYESSRVDGAGPVTQFTKITMPYILFVTGPYLITQFVGNINNFNVIYFLTKGGPTIGSGDLMVGQTDLMITFLYSLITSNKPQFGVASAIGIIIFVICAFFSIVMYNKTNSIQEEDQFQ